MTTIAVELYNWHSKTTNDNKLIKTTLSQLLYNEQITLANTCSF